MLMYNILEYSNNYWKTFGSLWHGDEPALSNDGVIIKFPNDHNNKVSFKVN